MIGWLILAVFLFALCGCLIVAEMLIPSFGLISIASLACLGGGLFIFRHYELTGIGIIMAVIVVPITLIIAYKRFPQSKAGKAVILDAEIKEPGQGVPDVELLKSLLGKKGITISTMRPVGKCEIDDRKIECVAEQGFVNKGVEMEVIRIEGSQVTVREIKKQD